MSGGSGRSRRRCTAGTLRRLGQVCWDRPPGRRDRSRTRAEHLKSLFRPNQARRPAGPKHAVVNLLRFTVRQAEYVDQSHESYSECLPVSVFVSGFRAFPVLLCLSNCFTRTPGIKNDDAFLTQRSFLPAPVNSIFEQQVGCVSHGSGYAYASRRRRPTTGSRGARGLRLFAKSTKSFRSNP